MVILMDDPSFGWRQQPTHQNILEAMRWLVDGAHPNDSLFFHYSGRRSVLLQAYDAVEYADWPAGSPCDYPLSLQVMEDRQRI